MSSYKFRNLFGFRELDRLAEVEPTEAINPVIRELDAIGPILATKFGAVADLFTNVVILCKCDSSVTSLLSRFPYLQLCLPNRNRVKMPLEDQSQ